mgnify:CR=1 FL=1
MKLSIFIIGSLSGAAYGADNKKLNDCLLSELKVAAKNVTVNQLYSLCEERLVENETTNESVKLGAISRRIIEERKTEFDPYVLTPHKMNYILPVLTTNNINKEAYSDFGEWSDNLEDLESKFQISLKKPLSYNLFGLNESINVAYTQTSWWQIYSESAPFRETNYQPEIFAIIPYSQAEKTALKAIKVAFLHESNGQGGNKSRSWNRVYLESFFQLNELFITPKIWYRLEEESQNDDNSDIEHYMGYGDVKFFYAYKDHTFKALIRNNLNFSDNKGYGEFNWSFPFTKRKNTFGYVQLSSGYGDSLIDYNKEVNRISFGISLSR